MGSSQKLKFCANLSMMYAKEAASLLDRYTCARSYGFKGVECAFPYDFSKEDLIKAKTDDLEQVLINADPGSSLGYAALVGQEDNFMKSLEKSLDYCVALKCKRLHIMSGRIGADSKGTENKHKNFHLNTQLARGVMFYLYDFQLGNTVYFLQPCFWFPELYKFD